MEDSSLISIPPDIFHSLRQILSIRDICSLRWTSIFFYKYVFPSVRDILELFKSRLFDRLKKDIAFVYSIGSNNWVISGSFILEVFNDTTYTGSDLDIYISYGDIELLSDYYPETNTLQEIKKKIEFASMTRDNGLSTTHKFRKIMNHYSNRESSYPLDFLSLYIGRLASKRKINLVITPNDPMKKIIEKCDITFCKNYFDSENIYIGNINDLIEKKGIIKITPHIAGFKRRYKKYSDRGYDLKIYRSIDTYSNPMQIFDDTGIKFVGLGYDNKKYDLLKNMFSFGELDLAEKILFHTEKKGNKLMTISFFDIYDHIRRIFLFNTNNYSTNISIDKRINELIEFHDTDRCSRKLKSSAQIIRKIYSGYDSDFLITNSEEDIELLRKNIKKYKKCAKELTLPYYLKGVEINKESQCYFCVDPECFVKQIGYDDDHYHLESDVIIFDLNTSSDRIRELLK